MNREFEKDSVRGLICPWCKPPQGHTYIDKCPHNPFTLMNQVDRLRAELDDLQQAQELITLIRTIARG